MTTWRSVHTIIDGAIVDRETGYPDLELTLEPMGRALPKSEQTRELTLVIGSKKTVLDEAGIEALIEFLKEQP